jgi:hypothetical protein
MSSTIIICTLPECQTPAGCQRPMCIPVCSGVYGPKDTSDPLAAAAPEMLDALIEAAQELEALRWEGRGAPIVQMLLAVIAKAEGGAAERRDETKHASTSPGPVNCSTRLRLQNQKYPRTCVRCGLGQCPFFNNDGSAKP